jgi:hypothetical protein
MMKRLSFRPCVWLCVLCIFCIMATYSQADQKVKISFDDYHGYGATAKYLKKVAKAYPKIAELMEIGQSNMGRPIYVLVISNMNTGTTIDALVKLRNLRKEGVQNVIPMKPYQGKSGHWICGTTHGNEYTGTEVCLYIIDQLVSGYGSDSDITRLVDEKTFYICPVVNPDGLYNSIEKGISQRQNSMEKDDDEDGRINEDGPDDLNGDGHLTRFRYPDPKGQYVMDDIDPRLMIRLGRNEKTDKPRYSVITEDKDNDGDGKRGEDSERGIDLNRNFPEGWFNEQGFAGGAGDYPTSAPETHAIAEFFTNHRNILMAQFFHTSGGFTYRPLGTAPHTQLHAKDVAVFDMVMGKKYLEIIGEDIPEAWQYPDSLSKFKDELKKTSKNKYAIQRGYVLPRGWRVSYNEDRDTRYSYGMATDWAYLQYGIYSITTELWNPQKDIDGFPQFSGRDAWIKVQRELLKWQDENQGGEWFIPWEKYNHPELGEGEIGGWIPKYRSNAFPGEILMGVCEKHWQFAKFRAGLTPNIEISDAKAKVLYTTDNARMGTVSQKGNQVTIKRGGAKGKYKVVEVTAKIKNTGKLATHVARGAQLSCNREDVVWLVGDREKVTFLQGTPFLKLGMLEGVMKIPGYRGREGRAAQPGQPRGYGGFGRFMMAPEIPKQTRLRQKSDERPEEKKTGPTREVKWLVAVEGNSPLKIVVSSQKGGTRVENLTIQ